jgi:hypothetical protein
MKFLVALVVVVAIGLASSAPGGLKLDGPTDIMIIMKQKTAQVLNKIESQTFVNADSKVQTLYNELNSFTSQSQVF